LTSSCSGRSINTAAAAAAAAAGAIQHLEEAKFELKLPHR